MNLLETAATPITAPPITAPLDTSPDTSPDTSRATSLSVEVFTTPGAFQTLAPEWNRLVESAGLEHPFATCEWVETWWECFGAGRKLYILLVRDGAEPIAIAPLMIARRKMYGLSVRSLEFAANVHTPRCDFIVSKRPEQAYRAIWDHLLRQKNLWDVMTLTQIPEGSPALQHLPSLAEAENFSVGHWVSGNSPYLATTGNWESCFAHLSSKHRSNVRRNSRRLSELGEVRTEIIATEDGLPGALEDGFAIEGAAWKDQQGTSIRSHPDVRQFYDTLARRFARTGWLRLYFLNAAGKRIAFHYSVFYKNRLFLLKPGYDPSHATYSPAHLLCSQVLQDAFAAGFTEFDFLGVEEEWKRQWTRTGRNHCWLFLFPNTALASLLYWTKFRFLPALRRNKSYAAVRHWIVSARQRLGMNEALL